MSVTVVELDLWSARVDVISSATTSPFHSCIFMHPTDMTFSMATTTTTVIKKKKQKTMMITKKKKTEPEFREELPPLRSSEQN